MSIVRTTKSFGGGEYPQTLAQTAEICVSYYQIQKVPAIELPIDMRSMENSRELACERVMSLCGAAFR